MKAQAYQQTFQTNSIHQMAKIKGGTHTSGNLSKSVNADDNGP
jgi:hypothetical protein